MELLEELLLFLRAQRASAHLAIGQPMPLVYRNDSIIVDLFVWVLIISIAIIIWKLI